MTGEARQFSIYPFILRESVRFADISSRNSSIPSPWDLDAHFGILTFDIVQSNSCPDPALVINTLDECAEYNRESWETQSGILCCLSTPFIFAPILAVKSVNSYPHRDYIAHLTVPIHATILFPQLLG